MFNFWWLAKQSEWWKSTKMQKSPPKSLKDEMLIFGLCSTSDDRPSYLSNESWQKCTIEVPQNDSEWPIWPDLQLFQSFPTEVAQDNLEWPISSDLQLFQSFPTKVAQNDLEQPILHGKRKHYDTREFLWKITLLHGQLCQLCFLVSIGSSLTFVLCSLLCDIPNATAVTSGYHVPIV